MRDGTIKYLYMIYLCKEAKMDLTKRYKIADVVISDPPIEEIIEMVYRK